MNSGNPLSLGRPGHFQGQCQSSTAELPAVAVWHPKEVAEDIKCQSTAPVNLQ